MNFIVLLICWEKDKPLRQNIIKYIAKKYWPCTFLYDVLCNSIQQARFNLTFHWTHPRLIHHYIETYPTLYLHDSPIDSRTCTNIRHNFHLNRREKKQILRVILLMFSFGFCACWIFESLNNRQFSTDVHTNKKFPWNLSEICVKLKLQIQK